MEAGIEAAFERKPRTKPPKITFDGAFEARLTALAAVQVKPQADEAGGARAPAGRKGRGTPDRSEGFPHDHPTGF